jgi:hypothetical protein
MMTEKQYSYYAGRAWDLRKYEKGDESIDYAACLKAAQEVLARESEYRAAAATKRGEAGTQSADIDIVRFRKHLQQSAKSAGKETPVEAQDWSPADFPSIRKAIGDKPLSAALEKHGLYVYKPLGGMRITEKGRAFYTWLRGQIAEQQAAPPAKAAAQQPPAADTPVSDEPF